MNKKELVAKMAEKAGLKKTEAEKALKAFTETVAEAVSYTHLTLPTIRLV